MADSTTTYTRVATGGLIVTIALAGLMVLLKSQGIGSFGPIPTLVLPLSAFVARAWWLANVAPERIKDRQRSMAILITVFCIAALTMAGFR